MMDHLGPLVVYKSIRRRSSAGVQVDFFRIGESELSQRYDNRFLVTTVRLSHRGETFLQALFVRPGTAWATVFQSTGLPWVETAQVRSSSSLAFHRWGVCIQCRVCIRGR